MLLDIAMVTMEKLTAEMRDANPQKRERFIGSLAALLETSAEVLRTSLRQN